MMLILLLPFSQPLVYPSHMVMQEQTAPGLRNGLSVEVAEMCSGIRRVHRKSSAATDFGLRCPLHLHTHPSQFAIQSDIQMESGLHPITRIQPMQLRGQPTVERLGRAFLFRLMHRLLGGARMLLQTVIAIFRWRMRTIPTIRICGRGLQYQEPRI